VVYLEKRPYLIGQWHCYLEYLEKVNSPQGYLLPFGAGSPLSPIGGIGADGPNETIQHYRAFQRTCVAVQAKTRRRDFEVWLGSDTLQEVAFWTKRPMALMGLGIIAGAYLPQTFDLL
jgi:hypothetical protein